jgi:hypothetical protein
MMNHKELRERLFEISDQLQETSEVVQFSASSPISAEDAGKKETQLVKATGSGIARLIDECHAFLKIAEPMIARYKKNDEK